MTPALKRMIEARTALVLDQPFFGALALRLKLKEDPSCGTAWTDGASLGYSPTFIEKLTRDELVAVVAHEVMHCANGHPWRRDNREMRRANIAMDYAINPVLTDVGFKLPAGCLLDPKWHGKSFEWIYARLPEQSPEGGPGDGDGERKPMAGGQDVRDAKPSSGDGQDGGQDGDAPSEADWKQAVQQAAVAAKARGKLPAGLERFAKSAAESHVNWRSVLRRFVQQAAKTDYSWTRPNSRHLVGGFYLPSLRSEAMGPIAFGIDCSGSVDAVMLGQMQVESQAAVDETSPERVHVIYFDAKVHKIDVFERGEALDFKMVGGGGTSFVGVMDAVDEIEDLACVVMLTDLYGEHRDAPPAAPVLWVTTTEGAEVPYGEVVPAR